MLQNTPHFVLAAARRLEGGRRSSCRSTRCTSPARSRHVLRDAEVAALICSDRAWEAYLRETAAASPVRIALTACELDLQTRDDARVLRFERLPAPPDADDLLAVGPRRPPGPRRAADPGRRRHRPDQLHLRHQRHPQGRHEHPRRTSSYNAEPAAHRPALPEGSVLLRARARSSTSPAWSAQLSACLANAGTLVLAYRFEAGRRPGRVRRAPPRLHRRPVHRLHGAGRPPGRHPRTTSPPSR